MALLQSHKTTSDEEMGRQIKEDQGSLFDVFEQANEE